MKLSVHRLFAPACLRGASTAAFLICLSASASADLVNQYWDTNSTAAGSSNTTNNNWGTGSVWNLNADGTGATGLYDPNGNVFFAAGTNATGSSTVLISGPVVANSMTFEEGIFTFTGSGSTPALSIGAGGITMNNGLNGTVTIGGSLGTVTLNASQSWTNNTVTATGPPATTARALTVGNASSKLVGSATAGNTTALTIAGTSTATTTINSSLEDGAGGGNLAIVKAGVGNLVLGGTTNIFSGGVTLQEGTLSISNATGLGTGRLTVTGGTLAATTITGFPSLVLNNNFQTWSGTFGFGGSRDLDMGTGAVTLAAATTISVTGTGTAAANPTYVVGGAIGQSGGATALTTQNATAATNGISAILKLTSTASNYTGGTNINGGAVELSSVPATGNITVGARGALIVGGAYNTLAGWLGDSHLVTTSTGALALTASSSENYTPGSFASLSLGAQLGTTVVYTGTITTPSATAAYFIGGGGGSIEFSNTGAFTGTKAVTIGGGGGGKTIISGANTYTGLTSVKAAAALVVRNSGALGSSTGTPQGTEVAAGGTVQLENNVNITGETLKIAGTSATASPSNYTAGLSNLSGDNRWGGAVAAVLGSSQNVRFSTFDGTLDLAGNVVLSGNTGASLVLTGEAGAGTVSGVISQSATIVTPIIKNGAGTWNLTGANTFTGIVRIDEGVLGVTSIGNATTAGSLGQSASIINFGESALTGTLRYSGTGESSARVLNFRGTSGGGTIEQAGAGTLEFSGGVTNGSATGKILTLQGSSGGDGKISGAVTGAIGITKTGSGTWTLSAENTNTGATIVTGGTLIVSGKLNTTTSVTVSTGTFALGANGVMTDAPGPNTPVTMSLGEGAILQTAGFDDAFAALAVTGNAQLNLAGGNSVISFTDSSATNWTGGILSIVDWDGASAGGGNDQVTVAGLGGKLSQIFFTNPTVDSTLQNGTYTALLVGNEIVPGVLIPEPSVLLLGALGSVSVAFRRRRK